MKVLGGDATGNRTPVTGMKTLCPRPLDDGAIKAIFFSLVRLRVNLFIVEILRTLVLFYLRIRRLRA